MIILNAVQSIFCIVIMILVGYILTHKNWFYDNTSSVFAKLIVNISLPCLMLSNILSSFNKEKLINLSKGIMIPFLSMCLCYISAVVISKIIKVKKERVGVFRSMFFVSNTIFIGLPVNIALFGNVSIPYVLLYYIANTSLFWTIGVYEISKDSGQIGNRIFSKETIKRIMSPPLLGFIVAIFLVVFQIKLPKFIMDSTYYLGNLTTPLSMIFIGIIMYSVKLRDIKISKDMILVIVGRFIISPMIVFSLLKFYNIPKLMGNVFVIQSVMPVMTNSAIVAKSYNSDYEYATVMTVITTILSLVIIPFYMVLLG